MGTPRWPHWLSQETISLENCISISLNFEPFKRQTISDDGLRRSVQWEISPHCLQGGPDRLDDARVYFGSALLPAADAGPRGERRVRLTDFVRFAIEEMAWELPPKLTRILNGSDAHPAPQPKQRQQAQEEAILAKLAELGIDAQAVPAPPAGKPSPAKRAVREALGYSTDVMNKAWQRLRAARHIKDA